jgi:hypothetical protein
MMFITAERMANSEQGLPAFGYSRFHGQMKNPGASRGSIRLERSRRKCLVFDEPPHAVLHQPDALRRTSARMEPRGLMRLLAAAAGVVVFCVCDPHHSGKLLASLGCDHRRQPE